jgi:hypothetical protein
MRSACRWGIAPLLAAVAGLAAAAGLTVTRPAPGDVVHDNEGRVGVTVAIEDDAVLPRGYAIRLLLDGAPAAPDHRGLQFELAGVARGEHRLEAWIVDDAGRVLTRSPAVAFTVWQASRIQPRGR